MKKAVFLDRDGTTIFDEGYTSVPAKVALILGVANSLQKLANAGFVLVIVTNQSGIGRGYFTEKDMHRVNNRMLQLLKKEDVFIDAIYFCPHKPEDLCECRKPKPGLLLKAAQDLNIDLSSSVMIGDKISDLEAGINAGCKYNILISNEKKLPTAIESNKSVLIVNSLGQAVDIILSNT